MASARGKRSITAQICLSNLVPIGPLLPPERIELSALKSFTVATDVKVYFCDPQSPWQRGTNEKHQWPAAPVLP